MGMSAGAKCLRPEKGLQHRRFALAAKASKAPKTLEGGRQLAGWRGIPPHMEKCLQCLRAGARLNCLTTGQCLSSPKAVWGRSGRPALPEQLGALAGALVNAFEDDGAVLEVDHDAEVGVRVRVDGVDDLTACQRRSKNASVCRSKNTSVLLARRPRTGGLFLRHQAWVG